MMNSRPLRVAMICQGYFPLVGGAERQVASVSQELAQRGVEVHVLTRRFSGLQPEEKLQGVTVHRLPAPRPKALASLTFSLSALPLIHRLRPDILHAHELLSPATTAVAAGLLYQIPVVATVHGGGEIHRLKEKAFGKVRLNIFRSRIKRFITIGKEIDDQLASEGVPDDIRTWIPNGVDLLHFHPILNEKKEQLKVDLQLPPGPLVVFTGRLVQLKRVDQLIIAWRNVRKQFPQASLLILGTGPEHEALQQLAYSTNVHFSNPQDDHGTGVYFLGEIQDVAPYLQAADLFILPSSREGLSVSLLEAMACGLPVIATQVGGNVDLVHHLQTGWLIPDAAGDELPHHLSEAVQTLLTDTSLQTRLAQAGRELVTQTYSLARVAADLSHLYTTLAADSSQQQKRGIL